MPCAKCVSQQQKGPDAAHHVQAVGAQKRPHRSYPLPSMVGKEVLGECVTAFAEWEDDPRRTAGRVASNVSERVQRVRLQHPR